MNILILVSQEIWRKCVVKYFTLSLAHSSQSIWVALITINYQLCDLGHSSVKLELYRILRKSKQALRKCLVHFYANDLLHYNCMQLNESHTTSCYKEVKTILIFNLNRRRKLRLRLEEQEGKKRLLEPSITFLWKRVRLIFLPETNRVSPSFYMPMIFTWNCWDDTANLSTQTVSLRHHFSSFHQWNPGKDLPAIKGTKILVFQSLSKACPSGCPYLKECPHPVPTVTLGSLPYCVFFREPNIF